MNVNRRHRVGFVTLATVVAGLAMTATPVGAAVEPPSPASGHAEVVAQSLVRFEDGPWHWQLTTTPVGSAATSIPGASPAFLVADGPAAVLLSNEIGPFRRLAAGEATFRNAGPTSVVTMSAGATSGISEIAMVPGDGANAFTPGAGLRDVDLVRDVLATNEALILSTDVSAFVVVAQGTVAAGATPVAVGTPAVLTGPITLINTSPDVAIVLVAVIGPPIDASFVPATSIVTATTSATTSGGSGGGGGGSATTPTTTSTSATSTTSTSTTSTTTTTEPAPDTDSDGLTDAEEMALGTDPNNQDSDMDGIPDGREVNSLNSNPLDTDTDSDALTDALEVDKSCDINMPDTDGDGLGDAFEANSGFSECSLADTDGDGDDDLAEFSIGTDPRDPDCFSGPGSVCLN